MKKTYERSIFPKLLLSYFLYALIAVIIVIGGVMFSLTLLGQGNMRNLIPSEMMDEKGELRSEELLYQLGGWAERLDDAYRVTAVYGQQALPRSAYTGAELLSITAPLGREELYHAFFTPLSEGGMLIYIPTAQLKLQYAYDVGGASSGSWIGLLVLLLLVLEGVFISRFFYRKIQYPLTQLSEAMKRMEEGERDIALSFRAEGEFIRLRNAFNSMIRKLAAKEEENRSLQQAQQQMILELSHDIRTPIATIVACTSALEEGIVAPEEVGGYYQTIASKAGRVSAIADDMFTMLKMGSAAYRQHRQPVPLCEWLRRISADYYNDALQQGLEMVVDIPETEVAVQSDEALLHRAVGNLITNAIKYNRTGSMVGISLHLKPEGERAVIRISDDGEPIDPAFIPQLFEPFSRGDQARQTDGGTGLGLTIARSIVEKLGGSLTYQYAEGNNVMAIALPLETGTA